jgi:hypothetical protein
MPRRKSDAPPTDVNEAAHLIIERSFEKLEPDHREASRAPVPRSVSRFMSKNGRKGGRIGGKRRLKTMTAEDRSKIASNAAKARWDKQK